MSEIQSIEDKLSQLVPSAVSEHGLEQMNDTIDQLALTASEGYNIEREMPTGKARNNGWPKIGVWKAAAILVLFIVPAVILKINMGSADLKREVFSASIAAPNIPENPTGMKVLNTTQRIHSSEHAGVIIPDDGSAPQQCRSFVFIDEDQMRDEQTGTLVTVRASRLGVVTIPVTEF